MAETEKLARGPAEKNDGRPRWLQQYHWRIDQLRAWNADNYDERRRGDHEACVAELLRPPPVTIRGEVIG